MKRANLRIIEIEEGTENIFNKIIEENFPKSGNAYDDIRSILIGI